MWRSFFLAIGIYAGVLGIECLAIDHVELGRNPSSEPVAGQNKGPNLLQSAYSIAEKPQKQKKFQPREWMPWGLLGFGAVVVIYTISLPKKSE